MSYLARSLRTSRATTLLSTRRHIVASFNSSSRSLAMSEADHQKDDDSRPQKIESHKQESVSKAKTGKGEWKPELASQSEQIAQSEKNDMSVEEMQRMGKEKAEKGETPGQKP